MILILHHVESSQTFTPCRFTGKNARCLLSGYFNHRDPNQGTCTNSCRWDYKVKPAEENASGDIQEEQKIDFNFNQTVAQSGFANCGNVERHPAADQVYLIEE
ncbi:MAG: hypothetical protein GQ553_04135, partial [Nitrosomonadaceae bacterium]|nr:hypothetical protein [Nitrosomonadaceae bacterium]